MGWYIVTTEEMRALGLKGNDLTVFAVLQGFSQKGAGCYYGGQKLLAEICGVEPRTLRRIIDRLVQKGLVVREEIIRGNGKFCAYGVADKMSGGRGQNVRTLADKMSANNDNIKSTLSKDKDAGVVITRTREKFQKPTVEEVREYCESRRNGIDPEAFVAFYESNGWKVGRNAMKDWKAAVRTWEQRRREDARRPSTPNPSPRKGDYFLQGLKTLDRLNGTHYYEDYMNQVNQISESNQDPAVAFMNRRPADEQ